MFASFFAECLAFWEKRSSHHTKCSKSVNMLSVIINLFINSDVILNRDALWAIQGKKHYLQAAIVGGIHHARKLLR